jgi:EAL domain-containing protein (putative c-di-GMP-specific phosphodiesterase class I)/FixJ family two-component response regulator
MVPEAKSIAFVLDDDAKVGAVVCTMLDHLGYESKQFSRPVPFLSELKTAKPDLVLLDLALGQTDAIDIIRKMEILKFEGRVLLISGRDQATLDDIQNIGVERGLHMLRGLQKPFRRLDLQARLNQVPKARKASSDTVLPDQIRLPRVDLQQALQNKWLEVWYQPKFDLRSRTICGAEALIRARHPEFGITSPAELLPSAGDPLFQPLTVFVLQRTLSDWQLFAKSAPLLKLAINVPASVLSAPGFVDMVREMIPTQADFPGLILEVTEDEIIRDPAWVHEIGTQLRLYKTFLSIDDFGSAWASLSRLTELPFAELKLDRSFVSNCAGDSLKRALCQTVVDLAHRFDASVCAEGVETAVDLDCLIKMGFDSAQGFLFAKPMETRQLLVLLASLPHGIEQVTHLPDRHLKVVHA